MIFDDLQKVYELAIAYIGNGRYFALAAASMVFFFVSFPKSRVRFLYPILVVLVLIGTPWLYHFVFNRDAYWRTFWMFPGAILIALFCVKLIQMCRSNRERIGLTAFLLFILVFLGTNMYSAVRIRSDRREESILMEASNPEKVSKGVKRMADLLLSIEARPKVVSRKKYIYELRQYSSKIELYYGRDIDGFIIPVSQKKGWRAKLHKELESTTPNYYRILNITDKAGYNFLITSSAFRIPDKILDRYGYHEIAILDGSAVYYKEKPSGSGGNGTDAGADKGSDNSKAESVRTEQSVPESAAEGHETDESGQTVPPASAVTVQETQVSSGNQEDDSDGNARGMNPAEGSISRS